ncbi:MAG: heme biosynthesis HemY N-terminal domain-containing protein, partial [Pseudomonadota bacterium]
MLRVLLFVLVVFALGLGFAWLADVPGEVVLTIADKAITVPLMVVGVAIVATIAAFMLIWWLFKVVFTSPQRMKRFFRARRRDRGYQSLSTGIIAAGAGDSSSARKMLKQAGGLLDSTTEPLLHLLDAQATMLEGDHTAARKKFETMLDDPETRILGLRGLYMEAQRLGEREAQRHYAEKAAELAPQLNWASKAALDLKTADGDWDGAIRLLDKQKSTKQITKEEASRKRAVLLTALAQSNAETDPAKAKSAGLEAHKLAPEFAPAAVVAAEAAFRMNETRRGVKVLETTWRKQPHPDVALAYVNARPGDSAADRLKRAQRLSELKPNNTESNLIVAQIAMEASEFNTARKAVAAVLRDQPRESAFMLMADIEDAETGN